MKWGSGSPRPGRGATISTSGCAYSSSSTPAPTCSRSRFTRISCGRASQHDAHRAAVAGARAAPEAGPRDLALRPAAQALQLAPFGCFVLAPSLRAGALVEAFALHVLEQSRLGDLAAELLEDVLQAVVLAQRDFHCASHNERGPGRQPRSSASVSGLQCTACRRAIARLKHRRVAERRPGEFARNARTPCSFRAHPASLQRVVLNRELASFRRTVPLRSGHRR